MARGLTLIEVVVATFVLTLALMGFMAASSATAAQRSLATEDLQAEQALNDFLEELRGLSTPDLLTGTGWALPIVSDLPDAELRVVLVHDEGGALSPTPAALEWTTSNGALTATTLSDPSLLNALQLDGGLDLNADGDVDDAALPLTTEDELEAIRLVPALLELRWRSVIGHPRSLQFHAYLSDY